MGAIGRSILFLILGMACATVGAQDLSWSGLVEDTTYFAKDYNPDRSMVTLAGPAQTWDFRTLKAPYSISRQMIITGESSGKKTASLINGAKAEATVLLSAEGMEVTQIVEPNPICPDQFLTFTVSPSYKPFTSAVLGEKNVYNGKIVATFAWPRNTICQWSPNPLPDSCRITYTIQEQSMVDAEGLLYLPTEIDKATRQKVELKRALKIESKSKNVWRDVTAQVPGVRLITNRQFLRFFSDIDDVQLVEMEVNSQQVPVSIEFKTHPIITRVFTEEPSKPDIFAYPNPSYDIVRFQLANLTPGRYHLKIYNILGVPVKDIAVEVTHRRQTISVDLSAMQRGTYLFRLLDKTNRTIKTKRVVLIRS